MSSLHDDNFNFFWKDDKLYVGDGTNIAGNCAHNKNIVNAILPKIFGENQIYGTLSSCFESMSSLKSIFIPNTYKELGYDFCPNSLNVESIIFEENSQVEFIGRWFAQRTAITSIILPCSLRTFSPYCTFKGCTKLKQIIFLGRNKFDEDNNTLYQVPQDLVIFVGMNYRWKTFGGRKVTGVLYRYGQHICTCRYRRENKASLIFVVIIHL